MLRCNKCQEEKETPEYHKKSCALTGMCSICKSCCGRSEKERYIKNREKVIERVREYRKNNVEKIRKSKAEKSQTLPHKEWSVEYNKRYYLKNKERLNAESKIYRDINKEIINKKISEYMRTEKGKIIQRNKGFRRRAYYKNISLFGSFTLEEWRNLLERCGNQCAKCFTTEDLTADHIIPISKGGNNLIGNIQPLCRGCNASKGNRYVQKFI